MEKQIGKIKRKSRRSAVGSFFFGSFIGFILCIALLVGAGCFVYFKVSPQWIDNTFNANIDLGSDEINKKTMKDFVDNAINLGKNIDTYTLTNLEQDFGIDVLEQLEGFVPLDMSDLKDVAIPDLGNAMSDKFSNISADELKDIVDLDDMDKILSKTNTYYVSDGELYKDNACTQAVDFDAKVENGKVIYKGNEFNINAGDTVDIELLYLPIATALSDFTTNMGDKITLAELETDYGVELPSYFDNIDKENTTINELEEEINKLELAVFLGYEKQGTGYVDKSNNPVTGILARISSQTIGNVGNIKQIIDETEVGEVLDYSFDETTQTYFDDKDKDGQKDSGEELSDIISSIATTQVQNLSSKINNLTIAEVFGYTYDEANEVWEDKEGNKVTGALALINADTAVTDIPSALSEKFETVTMGEIIDNKVVSLTTSGQQKYDEIKDKTVVGTSTKVSEMRLTDLLEFAFNYIPVQ